MGKRIRRLSRTVFKLAIVWYSAVAVVRDTPAANDAALASPSRILAITDVVLQHHIDPPARQQMILSGVRALYRAENRQPPKDLSAKISQLADPGQIADYLRGLPDEFPSLKEFETVLAYGVLESLPGFADLIPAEDEIVQEQLRANRYVGVGIVLAIHEGSKLPQIPKAFPDGPAWHAGVQPDDLILEIDGQPTTSKELGDVVKILRGEAGTQLTMVVRQPNAQETRTLTMTRGRVFIPTVEGFRETDEHKWQYKIDTAPVAYLHFVNIGPSTVHELRQIEASLREKKLRGLILDLRGGGGTLHDVVMVADALLDGGVIGHVQSLDSTETYQAEPGALFEGLPLAVLIEKHANADRVFLAAALQDHQRAMVVGEPTFGETYVRSLLPIPGRGDKLLIATALMQRGDGTTLLTGRWNPRLVPHMPSKEQEKKRPNFIQPDHVVAAELSPDLSKDAMVTKAIEVLQSTPTQDEANQETADISG
jgi:carboxyl-terminal processing protease